MNSKVLLFISVALLSVATNGYPVFPKKDSEDPQLFFNSYWDVMEMSTEAYEIFEIFVSLCFNLLSKYSWFLINLLFKRTFLCFKKGISIFLLKYFTKYSLPA